MADDQIVALLGAVDLFTGLPPKVMRRIADYGEVVEHEPGAPVVQAGEQVSGFRVFSPKGVEMHVVLAGSAEVDLHGTRVASLGPRAYFGELSLIDGKPRSADVSAGPDGLRTFAMPKWGFDELLRDHPEVALPMLRALCAKLRRAEAAGH
ncbi:MAG TPA: cyclic nucleotide-binding domain-containing protein [Candidatus Nanopelagicales bacterium]